MPLPPSPLTLWQRALKRAFDIIFSAVGLLFTIWIIVPAALVARIDTRASGLFRQERIGRFGRPFTLLKIRTMRSIAGVDSTVTHEKDPRITRSGRFFRKTKIDELPQLFNVLRGDMSFVGPRPDVAGFADLLEGEDRLILTVRPGITGPATLAFRDEERLLAAQADPERYNREVIYPAKVVMNLEYMRNYSLREDIRLIIRTITGR